MTRFGKFEVLATFTYLTNRMRGLPGNEAKKLGFAVAVMGAHGHKGGHGKTGDAAIKQAASKKSRSTLMSKDFDKMVHKMGETFFQKTFEPGIARLINAGLNYDEIKSTLGLPPARGAKITDEHFAAKLEEFSRSPDSVTQRG
jgi:hypothetical protein